MKSLLSTNAPNVRCHLQTAFLFAFAAVSNACSSSSDEGSTRGSGPLGPVARDADEAFPDRPTALPELGVDDIARACVVFAGCGMGSLEPDEVGYCVGQFEFSAERAIPISALLPGLERVEYAVPCLIGAADCDAAAECFHERPAEVFYCEEDGCRSDAAEGETWEVSCDGTVATLAAPGLTVMRDCATSFAQCDESSPTGCTDRLFTQCPEDVSGDRCEGAVRLGCDSAGQVSYRDCGRLGGTCGESEDGEIGCLYADQDPECTDGNVVFSHCEGTNVVLCSNGRLTTLPAPDLCGGA